MDVNPRPCPNRVTRVEIVFGWCALVALPHLVLAGILVGTDPYRKALGGPFGSAGPDMPHFLPSLLVVLAAYTYPNILWLCYLSAFLGALGRRVHISGDAGGRRWLDGRSEYFAAILRGFFVYALLLLGLAVWMTEHHRSFLNPTQENYVLVAGAAILASFWLGNSPVAYGQTRTFLLRFLRARLNELDLDDDERPGARRAPEPKSDNGSPGPADLRDVIGAAPAPRGRRASGLPGERAGPIARPPIPLDTQGAKVDG
jgi:hypothetical protein